MTLQKSLRTINRMAKNFELTANVLEEYRTTSEIKELTYDEERIVDEIAEKEHVRLHLVSNRTALLSKSSFLFQCDIDDCTEFIVSGCEGCPYMRRVYLEYKEPDVLCIDEAIESLHRQEDTLYDLKYIVCDIYPSDIIKYVRVGNHHFKIMDVGGYRCHIPVSAEENEDIKSGTIQVDKNEYYHKPPHYYISYADFEEAVEFLVQWVRNHGGVYEPDQPSASADYDFDPTDLDESESDNINADLSENYIDHDYDDYSYEYDSIDSGID